MRKRVGMVHMSEGKGTSENEGMSDVWSLYGIRHESTFTWWPPHVVGLVSLLGRCYLQQLVVHVCSNAHCLLHPVLLATVRGSCSRN